MGITDSEPNASLDDAYDDEDDQDESGDEEVLDELAVKPTPRMVVDSDVIIEESALPGDLPGRADNTDEDLSALFRSTSTQHLADGFTGSGDEDGENISQNDGDDVSDLPEHPAGS
jgi:hypothetical protein